MSSKVQIAAVTAEHHESGFGVAHSTPRLSWRFDDPIDDNAKDWKQASYEIAITPHSGKEESFRIDGEQNVLVPWPGQPIPSRQSAAVSVRVQGRDELWTDWKGITIETGISDPEEWKAEMISCPPQNPEGTKPPFRVRKSFKLETQPTRARVYATAYGIYELEINGQKIGDQVLAPGWTSYRHHLNYQTYDVTKHLKHGDNTIGAYIGEGWYAGRLGRPGTFNNFGKRLGFFCQLENKGEVMAVSDQSWEYLDGPIVTSEIYDGESFDSRLDDPTWATPGTSVKAKGKVEILPPPTCELVATDAPPVRRVMELKPKTIIATPSGKKVLDFGQNLVGWLRVDKELQGEEGSEVVLRHAEVMEHEELGVRPLRTAKCQDVIVLGGKTKGWEPRFTFHGFRYAEINGVDDLDLNSFTAIVIFSDLRQTGTFTSSHKLLNQLHSNVIWGMRGNFVSVPTDCPQRDERLGWTGDIQVFTPTANYLFDTSAFLGGWLRDVQVETKEFGGVVPTVVPFVFLHKPKPVPHAIWADCIAMTPWDLYTSFEDRGVLQDNFDAMLLWLEKGIPRGADGLWDKLAVNYGDWLDPKAPPQYPAHGVTDTHLCANAYLVHVTGLVARIAKLIGKTDVADTYSKQYQRLRDLFRSEYVTSNGRLVADTQTAYALALQFGLLDEKQKVRAVQRFEHLIRWNHFKISTGFAGTPVILPILADNGLLHLAYRMLQERDNPSWLYPVRMGATTIWERWDSMLPDGTINPGQMTSFNHYALGSVAAFLHNVVGGLSPLTPGWKQALIRPQPGGTVTSASTSFSSSYGNYAVSWKLNGEKLAVDIQVPPNASAEVVLPGVSENVGSGKRHYNVVWKNDSRFPPKGIPGPQSIPIPDEFAP